MIVGIVLVLILGGLVELFRDVVEDRNRARRLAARADEHNPALRREVAVKNPVRNR